MNKTNQIKMQILDEFLKIVRIISDKNYQNRVWIQGSRTEINCYDDCICDFFDLGEYIFINPVSYGITDQQFSVLIKFRDMLEKFSSISRYEPEFIDTPEWDEITKMAAEVLKAFNYKSTGDKKNILHPYLQDVYDILNKEHQMQEWILAEGPECNDYDGNRCRFLDKADLILENYKDFGITDSQYQIMKKFRDRYYAFSRAHSWPPEFTDIPEWTEIRELAKEVLKAFDYKP